MAIIDTAAGLRLPNVDAGGDSWTTDGLTDCDGHGTVVPEPSPVSL